MSLGINWLLRLGWVSLLQFLSCQVKNHPSQSWVGPLFTACQKYARIRSGPSPPFLILKRMSFVLISIVDYNIKQVQL